MIAMLWCIWSGLNDILVILIIFNSVFRFQTSLLSSKLSSEVRIQLANDPNKAILGSLK